MTSSHVDFIVSTTDGRSGGTVFTATPALVDDTLDRGIDEQLGRTVVADITVELELHRDRGGV